MKSFAFIWSLALLLSNCNPPCANEMPSLLVDVMVPAGRQVQNWQVLNQTGLASNVTTYEPTTGRRVLEFPLNLNTSFTRYTVQIDGKTDTLTVNYAVRLANPSDKCGYNVLLDRPTQGPTARRALGPVDAVYYSGDTLPANLPVGYMKPGSIRVQLSL